jgi:hypothetical protein
VDLGFVLLVAFVVAVGVVPAVVAWWRAPPDAPPADDAAARLVALLDQGKTPPEA